MAANKPTPKICMQLQKSAEDRSVTRILMIISCHSSRSTPKRTQNITEPLSFYVHHQHLLPACMLLPTNSGFDLSWHPPTTVNKKPQISLCGTFISVLSNSFDPLNITRIMVVSFSINFISNAPSRPSEYQKITAINS